MNAPAFTVHWTSPMSGNRLSSACATKKAGMAECKALYMEGARNISLSEYKKGIGARDIDWRVALRNR